SLRAQPTRDENSGTGRFQNRSSRSSKGFRVWHGARTSTRTGETDFQGTRRSILVCGDPSKHAGGLILAASAVVKSRGRTGFRIPVAERNPPKTRQDNVAAIRVVEKTLKRAGHRIIGADLSVGGVADQDHVAENPEVSRGLRNSPGLAEISLG